MIAIGSDFVKQVAAHKHRCSECFDNIPAGAECLVSIRKGKVQKRVCGEECRLEFDARYWDEVAQQRARGQR